MKIKSKLLLAAITVVLFIMVCSTAAVYMLVNKQNSTAVRHDLGKTIVLIKDDLSKRQAKQLRDTRQNVTVNKLGEIIKFLTDFAGQINITRDGYIKITTSLSQLVAASDFRQAAIYDRKGALVASVRSMPDRSLGTAP